MAMTPTTAIPPTIHQIALDFFRVATCGIDAGGGAYCRPGDADDADGGVCEADGVFGRGSDG